MADSPVHRSRDRVRFRLVLDHNPVPVDRIPTVKSLDSLRFCRNGGTPDRGLEVSDMTKQIQITRRPPKRPADDREGTWPDWVNGSR